MSLALSGLKDGNPGRLQEQPPVVFAADVL